jgi:hypothetical protein
MPGIRHEGSRSFLKKRTKKLLLIRAWGVGDIAPMAQMSKSFLRRFFSKKRLLPHALAID